MGHNQNKDLQYYNSNKVQLNVCREKQNYRKSIKL